MGFAPFGFFYKRGRFSSLKSEMIEGRYGKQWLLGDDFMSKIEIVQKAMIQAMKNHDSERKETLTLLLSALKLRAKDKRADLTEEEEEMLKSLLEKVCKNINV